MQELITDDQYLKSYYDASRNALVVIWKHNLTEDIYKAIWVELLEVQEKKRATTFISDMRSQGYVSFESRQWLMNEVLPLIAVDGLKHVLLVTDGSTADFQQAYIQSVAHAVSDTTQLQVEFRQLPTLEAALALAADLKK